MDRRFIMGRDDGITRALHRTDRTTHVSAGLRANLWVAAMKTACEFYFTFFEKPTATLDYPALLDEYDQAYSHALSLGLFERGSIREKDHLNFWCLSRILSPEVYVESGVFVGTSLHAFFGSPGLKRTFAIDPDLSRLRLLERDIPGATLIDDRDFSQVEFDLAGQEALVYFDDHINSAERILQAARKGFRYLLFDDSTGFEGVCQRLYPAIPTVPMIMNSDLLRAGEELAWSFHRPVQPGVRGMARSIVQRIVGGGSTRLSYVFTQETINKCVEAKSLILKCRRIPDLGEFVPQRRPERMPDTSKFLIELETTSS